MKKGTLLPKEYRILQELGENLKLARKRRKLSMELLSERANISRSTLWSIEQGKANVSLETLLQVLSALGLAEDLKLIAANDELGRKLQDASLISSKDKKKK